MGRPPFMVGVGVEEATPFCSDTGMSPPSLGLGSDEGG